MEECKQERKIKERKKIMNRSAVEVAHDVRHLMKGRRLVVLGVEYFRRMSKRANVRDAFICEVNDELKKDGLIAIRWGGEIMFMKWRFFTNNYYMTPASAKKKIRAGYLAEKAIVPKIYRRRLTLVKKAV